MTKSLSVSRTWRRRQTNQNRPSSAARTSAALIAAKVHRFGATARGAGTVFRGGVSTTLGGASDGAEVGDTDGDCAVTGAGVGARAGVRAGVGVGL